MCIRMDGFSWNNLKQFLESKDYTIIRCFSCSKMLMAIHLSKQYQEILVTVRFGKYPIYVSGSDVQSFTLPEEYAPPLPNVTQSYMEIENNELELKEVSHNISNVLEMYDGIDLEEDEMKIIKYNVYQQHKHLKRLRKCTFNLKYKPVLLAASSFSLTNTDNTVESYVIQKKIPSVAEAPSLIISIDLEDFYNHIDTIIDDVTKIYNKLHEMLLSIHEKQKMLITSKVASLTSLTKNISDKFKVRTRYERTIKDTTDLLTRINNLHDNLVTEIEKERTRDSTNPVIVGKLNDFKRDLEQLVEYKSKISEIFTEIKKDYSDLLLQYDGALFDTVVHLELISNNVKRIGISLD